MRSALPSLHTAATESMCAAELINKPTWIRSLSPEEALGNPYTTAAICTASEVADSLGIDPESISVTLYVRCSADRPDAAQVPHWRNGFTPTAEHVFISAELTPLQLLATTAHETRHIWQIREGWPALRGRAAMERDASAFGHDWAQRSLRDAWAQQNPGQPVPKGLR